MGGMEIQPARGTAQTTMSRHRRYCLELLGQFIPILLINLPRMLTTERAEIAQIIIKIAYFCELVLN